MCVRRIFEFLCTDQHTHTHTTAHDIHIHDTIIAQTPLVRKLYIKSQVARNNVATSRAMTAGIMMINGLTVVV